MVRQIIAAAVVTLSLVSGVAVAQESTVVVTIPTQTRNGGVYQSTSWLVPADAVGSLNLRAEMATAEYEDPANHLLIRIYALDTTTGSWRRVGGNDPDGWTGGRVIGLDGTINPPVEIGIGLGALRGRQIRAEVEIFTRMRIGTTLFTIP